MNLSNLHNQQTAFVLRTTGSPSLRLRLEELGFVPGQEVTRLFATPMGSPIVFAMLGQRVALRSSEAALIEVSLEQPDIDYASEETLSNASFYRHRQPPISPKLPPTTLPPAVLHPAEAALPAVLPSPLLRRRKVPSQWL